MAIYTVSLLNGKVIMAIYCVSLLLNGKVIMAIYSESLLNGK